ncbi:MAG: hypothetical protein A2Y62_06620 [Candidatus Fischerbacteria bacterium RBG_13_37_8]|uniref:Uncharacterized protein n=1 Tax=Candidatus Fischerbacteria bacterium RBG_13_37_8 TaxID=1817863 RepID=A0A1F5VJT1_9BACT|nr:MAG: hypothetical protein A2Y62_06620 [Candidatus Fischerbacteria bacterium RBG_13_37_8]
MGIELSKELRDQYQKTLDLAKKQIQDIENTIEDELAKVKERLAELQNKKKTLLQMYAAGCEILGTDNEFEKSESSGQGADLT